MTRADQAALVRRLRAEAGELLAALTATVAAGRPTHRARQRLRRTVRRLRRVEQAQRERPPFRHTP